jgi:hypothetical protein
MALGDTYVTLSELKLYMGLSNETQFDAVLTDALESVSEEIELFCFRQFNDAGSATARQYSAVNGRTLFVDDFSTITGLVIKTDEDDDGVFEKTLASTDVEIHPIGGIRYGMTGWPFVKIRAVGSDVFPTSGRRTQIEVTARWGWAAVPDPVKQACKILAAKTHQLKDAPLGVAGMGEFGVVRVVDDKMAAAKLRRYVRRVLSR